MQLSRVFVPPQYHYRHTTRPCDGYTQQSTHHTTQYSLDSSNGRFYNRSSILFTPTITINDCDRSTHKTPINMIDPMWVGGWQIYLWLYTLLVPVLYGGWLERETNRTDSIMMTEAVISVRRAPINTILQLHIGV
jgi:hypothetical protein